MIGLTARALAAGTARLRIEVRLALRRGGAPYFDCQRS